MACIALVLCAAWLRPRGIRAHPRAARTVEPALSPDPVDYVFDDSHFNNEIAGDGEIGVTLGSMG